MKNKEPDIRCKKVVFKVKIRSKEDKRAGVKTERYYWSNGDWSSHADEAELFLSKSTAKEVMRKIRWVEDGENEANGFAYNVIKTSALREFRISYVMNPKMHELEII